MAPRAAIASATSSFLWLDRIVHDDDVAGQQFTRQELAHVLSEDGAVDWPAHHQWRDQAGGGEARDEGRCLPMSCGRIALHPLAARTTAIEPHHVGGGAGFVDEDQPMRRELSLALAPAVAESGDLRPKLLGGVNAFF